MLVRKKKPSIKLLYYENERNFYIALCSTTEE